MRTPFPAFSPELLARIAQAAHRPPGPGGAPGLPGMQAPQGGGMGLSKGMAGLGMGLANWRPPGWVPTSSGSEPGRTTGDADLGGYGGFPVDPMSGNPNAVPQMFNPSGAASGGGWFRRNFGIF